MKIIVYSKLIIEKEFCGRGCIVFGDCNYCGFDCNECGNDCADCSQNQG